MKIGNKETAARVAIVAEIGNNHEGDFGRAREMVFQAHAAGADAVKFQTFVPELFVSPFDSRRITQLRKFQFNYDQFEQLKNVADSIGIEFFSTPLDIPSAQFLNGIQRIFKISSGDNTFWPLIDEIATMKKPLIVSTGLCDLKTLTDIKNRVIGHWQNSVERTELAFLHCTTNYPTLPENANLAAIHVMRTTFPDLIIGFSDHTIGVDAAVFAVAAGARIIEKHFTLDKHQSEFRDHQLSADPRDFATMVARIQEAEEFLGAPEKKPQQTEAEYIPIVRRSICAAIDIVVGTKLETKHFVWLRPGNGMPPGTEHQLIGKRVRARIPKGTPFQFSDLE